MGRCWRTRTACRRSERASPCMSAPWMRLKAHTHTPQSPSDTHVHSDLSPAAVEAGGWEKGQQDEPERLRLKVVFHRGSEPDPNLSLVPSTSRVPAELLRSSQTFSDLLRPPQSHQAASLRRDASPQKPAVIRIETSRPKPASAGPSQRRIPEDLRGSAGRWTPAWLVSVETRVRGEGLSPASD